MSIKLLLAEALDTVRKGAQQEAAADRLQLATAKGQTKGRDFGRVKHDYRAAYDTYLRGLELLNFCRRQGIDAKLGDLLAFTTSQMNLYMDKCEALREKESNILMSVEQVDAGTCLDKEGFGVGETLIQGKRDFKKAGPLAYHSQLDDGAYQLLVKNYDAPGMGSAEVVVSLLVDHANGKQTRAKRVVGPKCAWSRFVGVVRSGGLSVQVTTDAWLRHSTVEVVLRRLVQRSSSEGDLAGWPGAMTGDPVPEGGGEALPAWADELPALPPVPTAHLGATAGAATVSNATAPPTMPQPQQHSSAAYQQPPYPSLAAPPPQPYGGYPQPGQPGPPQPNIGYPIHGDGALAGRPTPTPPPGDQSFAAVPPRAPSSSDHPELTPPPTISSHQTTRYTPQIPLPDDSDDLPLDLRLAQLSGVVTAAFDSKPCPPPAQSPSAAATKLVATVSAFPDPTPLLNDEAEGFDIGDIDLGDMEFE